MEELLGKRIKCACGQVQKAVPTTAQDYLGRAEKYHTAYQWRKAVAQYTEAIRLEATCKPALTRRAEAYDSLHEYEMAIADYTELLRLQPDDPTILVARGHVYQYKKEPHKALADYSEALRLDPKNTYYYLQFRAKAYRALGDEENAAQEDKKAQALKSGRQLETDSGQRDVQLERFAAVFAAIKAHWKLRAARWWQSGAQSSAVCDHGCGQSVAFGAGFMKGGNYLLCDGCTETVLRWCVEEGWKAEFGEAANRQLAGAEVLQYLVTFSAIRPFIGGFGGEVL